MDLNKVNVGDIIFTRDDGFISNLIRLVETGKPDADVPSHCAIVDCIYLLNSTIVINLIEASYWGVRHITLDSYLKNSKVWLSRMTGFRDIEKGLKWLDKQVGKPYDFTQLIGIFIRALLRWSGLAKFKWAKNFLDSKQEFICSELVEKYADETGERLWNGEIGFVTPYDLFRSENLTIYS